MCVCMGAHSIVRGCHSMIEREREMMMMMMMIDVSNTGGSDLWSSTLPLNHGRVLERDRERRGRGGV